MARFSSKLSPELEAAVNYRQINQSIAITNEWKEPERRQELFNRYFKWRVVSHDLDHTHYMSVMTKDYDFEQKAWFAFTFGMTYRTPQSFAYTETFKDFHATSLDEIEVWHAANWKRTTYGTDARYNKGHFHSQCKSLKAWLNGKTFKQKFDSILVHDTQRKNFYALYAEVMSLYKFGRMTGWLTMQSLYDLLQLPIDPEDIMLDGFSPNNDSSMQSIWNGLCALTLQPEKMLGKYGAYQCTDKDVAWGKEMLMHFTQEAQKSAGFKIDSFRCESIYCQWKRLWGSELSKEYPGHASGDATSRYMYYRDNWPEIDWSNFRESLRQQPGIIKGMTFVDYFNQVFGATGVMMNMHEMFPDMPNGYLALDIDPNKYKVREIWTDDNLSVPTVDITASTYLSDIKTTPHYYEVI